MKITQPAKFVAAASNIPATGVTISDPGGGLGGSLTLQEFIDLFISGAGPYLRTRGGELGEVQDLGPIGASETIDIINANTFLCELDANATVNFTGWTNDRECEILVVTTNDGGFTATFSGITWPDGIHPTPDTGAGTRALWVFRSHDGGTVIDGFLLGGSGGSGSSGGGMVPYLIEVGETFTVPIKSQGLFTMPIDVFGALVVDGYLLEVN